jgi:dTDP-4-dehydrorhamnose reductase
VALTETILYSVKICKYTSSLAYYSVIKEIVGSLSILMMKDEFASHRLMVKYWSEWGSAEIPLKMSKIVVVGADGQVGQELQHVLRPLGELYLFNRQSLDLSQPDAIAHTLAPLQPNILVNAAAYTAVDKAESEPELAYAINAIAPTQLAKTAQALNASLIHISTDYVFDGTKGSPYQPNDPTHPMSVYGASKLKGEAGIAKNCDRHYILRTAWVYGSYGKSNFVKTMLRLGTERAEVKVVADQIGTPTWARSIAEAIATLILTLDPEPAPSGIYHFTNSGVASWYDFAIAIFEEARSLGIPLKIERVVPITTADYPTPAKRPSYSVLSLQEILPILGNSPLHWRVALRLMLVEIALNTESLQIEQRDNQS